MEIKRLKILKNVKIHWINMLDLFLKIKFGLKTLVVKMTMDAPFIKTT
jgi:hypothetical protein